MHTLCKRLVPEGKKTLIGFGDWSQQDGVSHKKPKAPVKKFRKELRHHATVVRIDEYRTSKTCSGCEHEENVFHVKHWQTKWDWKIEAKRYGLFPSHEVVRCKNCAKCWQRDVNASRNMYRLLNCLIEGEERPLAMNRVEQAAKKKINSTVKPSRGRRGKRSKPSL
jgi:transposase